MENLCPNCQARMKWREEYWGKLLKCPKCKQTFFIQKPSEEKYTTPSSNPTFSHSISIEKETGIHELCSIPLPGQDPYVFKIRFGLNRSRHHFERSGICREVAFFLIPVIALLTTVVTFFIFWDSLPWWWLIAIAVGAITLAFIISYKLPLHPFSKVWTINEDEVNALCALCLRPMVERTELDSFLFFAEMWPQAHAMAEATGINVDKCKNGPDMLLKMVTGGVLVQLHQSHPDLIPLEADFYASPEQTAFLFQISKGIQSCLGYEKAEQYDSSFLQRHGLFWCSVCKIACCTCCVERVRRSLSPQSKPVCPECFSDKITQL